MLEGQALLQPLSQQKEIVPALDQVATVAVKTLMINLGGL